MADRRGTKRHCAACGASYYDLNRTPVLCPKCGVEWQPPMPLRPTVRKVAPAEPELVEEEATEEETEATEEADEIEAVEEVDDLPQDEDFVAPDEEGEHD